MRKFHFALCGVMVVAAAACKDPLTVENKNNGDITNALATPADLEAFIGATYVTAHVGTLGGSNDGLQTQMFVMGLENVSALANFAMGPRSQIPRNPIDNAPNGQGDAGNLFDFSREHRAARMATVGIAKMNEIGFALKTSQAKAARDLAFARFSLGVALGNLALTYDSSSVLTENDDFRGIIPFSSYRSVMAAALANLDAAIAIASAPAPPGPTADWFPLPSGWISGNALTAPQFIAFARSYKAQFRANVARTPAERADSATAGGIVDWAQVIADANAGITADFNIAMNPTTGWDLQWVNAQFSTGAASWHQMSQFMLGMADTSGGFDAWLALSRFLRAPFPVVTKDNRFPSGGTVCNTPAPVPPACRTAQQGATVQGNFTTRPYFKNRATGDDIGGDPFGISQYDFYRNRQFFINARIDNYPIMTAAAMRLLAAEGYLRTGDFANAINRINVSRKAAGLDSIPNVITDTVAVVPGGTGCVPRVPDSAFGFAKTKCGNVWDALKFEYRMETAFTGYGNWYLPGRGWGDVPEGTAFNWPVPNEELLVRRMPIYGLGGVARPGGAGRGNYGLFAGGVY